MNDRHYQEDWLSMKRIAEIQIRGVTQQAVSKRIAGFVARGMLEPRRVRGVIA